MVTVDKTMLEYGILEVAWWCNGVIVDFEILTGVDNDSLLIERIYNKALAMWFAKAAAHILESKEA